MNDTDKVIIALGFFTLVGFMAYLYFVRTGPTTTASQELTVDDVKKVREEWRVARQ